MPAQLLLSHISTVSHCHCGKRGTSTISLTLRSDLVALSPPRRICIARGHSSNGSRPQVSSAQAPNAKANGPKRNGSTPSNQAGQATAPKAPGEASPKAKPAPKSKPFNNTNKFIVPEDKLEEFEAAWHEREDFMQQMPGFLGFSMEQKDGSYGTDFVTTSKWASIPEWEAYSLSEIARRSHLPWVRVLLCLGASIEILFCPEILPYFSNMVTASTAARLAPPILKSSQGVYQYVPAKGEGFPEDFIPFKAMDTLVNAKY